MGAYEGEVSVFINNSCIDKINRTKINEVEKKYNVIFLGKNPAIYLEGSYILTFRYIPKMKLCTRRGEEEYIELFLKLTDALEEVEKSKKVI